MRVWFKIVFAFLVIVGGAWGARLLIAQNFMPVRNVQIVAGSEAEPLLFTRIEKGLRPKLDSLQGKSIWAISLDEIMTLTLADRRVKSVEVQRQLPGQLKVVVTPHEPQLLLVKNGGYFLPVARDASLLPELKGVSIPDLPLLRGSEFLLNTELRQQALKLLESLPHEGLFTSEQVSELSYSEDKGFYITLVQSGAEVRLGKDRFDYRAGLVTRVLEYLKKERLRARVIDARLSKKVVVKLRNQT
ncbi:MAG: FtsQ-type POTRA domain-containing protein [Bdellovibrionales bacterium]|nr:FtsQ-type POTRA domain-containing protein [Bdellovibrionales bacterium]